MNMPSGDVSKITRSKYSLHSSRKRLKESRFAFTAMRWLLSMKNRCGVFVRVTTSVSFALPFR